MKTNLHFPLLTFVVGLFFISQSVQAQMTVYMNGPYKKIVTDNPNADRDIKVVTDFVNAMVVTEDQAKARSLIAPNFIHYGPAMADSTNLEQTMQVWQRIYQTQTNRKVVVNPISYRVLLGRWKGDWVSIWGDYTFTEQGKTITFPYNYVYYMNNGKIQGTRVYHDMASIMTQLDYKITPPEMTKK